MATKRTRSGADVFCGSLRMETETVFHADGTIRTFPCPYEPVQQVTRSGAAVKMKAKVVVEADGHTRVVPYQRGSGERYRRLMRTAHGEVKETHTDVIVKLQFRKSHGRYGICDMMEDEVDDMLAFIETTDSIVSLK